MGSPSMLLDYFCIQGEMYNFIYFYYGISCTNGATGKNYLGNSEFVLGTWFCCAYCVVSCVERSCPLESGKKRTEKMVCVSTHIQHSRILEIIYVLIVSKNREKNSN